MTTGEKQAVLVMTRSRGWEVVKRWLEAQARHNRDRALADLSARNFEEAASSAIVAGCFESVLRHVEGIAREAERDGEEG